MKGTIITVPCSGARVIATPVNGRPTLDRLRTAIAGGELEIVPGLNSIDYSGSVVPCLAFCDKDSKLKNQPINRDATILWDAALLRAGHPGLLKPDGRIADMLRGQIAVVVGDEEFMTAPALSGRDDERVRH